MRDEDSTRFTQWWTETGSKIDGKFTLAVACWEEAQKGLGIPVVTKPVDPIIGNTTPIRHCRVIDGVNYYGVDEQEKPENCTGCVARYDSGLCYSLGTECKDFHIIWIKEE